MPILHWLNKDEAVTAAKNCDYRLLEEVPELSYGEKDSENLLIQGDNLEALKALIPFYAGKVKCIFIDPPYNTKSAFEHYDDNLEHSKWLSLMYPRLELLRELLSEDGSIWITIDDREAHYLKVMADEIFGRKNFIREVIWHKRTTRENRAAIGLSHDSVLVYAKKEAVLWKEHRNKLPSNDKGYNNIDNDPRGEWRSIPFSAQGHRPNQMYDIETPTGEIHKPPKGRCWGATEPEFRKYEKNNRVYFPRNGNGKPRIKRFKWEDEGLVPMSLWDTELAGSTESSKKEILNLFPDIEAFATPKPEKLLNAILTIATNENDLVLDSFLGSATTSAVAQKMNRRYIGIEIGEHAQTHCQPRLKKVVDGEEGGISKAVNWQGGGGFKFIKLGHTVFDEYGCLNKEIEFPTLAAHIWYLETKQPIQKKEPSAFLGVYGENAYYLLYNGILGDRRPDGGNVLTSKVIKVLPSFGEHLKHGRTVIVYGESTRLGEARLQQENIVFKQIPYDVGAL